MTKCHHIPTYNDSFHVLLGRVLVLVLEVNQSMYEFLLLGRDRLHAIDGRQSFAVRQLQENTLYRNIELTSIDEFGYTLSGCRRWLHTSGSILIISGEPFVVLFGLSFSFCAFFSLRLTAHCTSGTTHSGRMPTAKHFFSLHSWHLRRMYISISHVLPYLQE